MKARPTVLSLARRCSSSSYQQPLPIVFMRHGQSTWNKANIFIGMTDTPLTSEGLEEAQLGGQLLKSHPEYSAGLDEVHTSLLRRSTATVWEVQKELEMEWLPVHKSFALNERNYGALVGKNKKDCVDKFGKDQVKLWRRSWDMPPPPMDRDSQYWPYKEARYRKLGIKEEDIPASESLKCVTKRTSQWWDSVLRPQLLAGKRVLIVGHENNLRSIIKRLDGISDADILHIELPRAVPLVFHLDRKTLKPVPLSDPAPGLSGKYLMQASQLEAIAVRDHTLVYGEGTSVPVPSFASASAEKTRRAVEQWSVHPNIRSATA